MKVLLAVAVWGRDYVKTFADYALASQLSANNIPRLAKEHDVTYHIVTTRKDAARLNAHPMMVDLRRHCRVEMECMEDHGYNARIIPEDLDGRKYSFLSLLQNIAISRSLAHDCLVFNYADFIWADGSLTHSVRLLGHGVDAVLSFCLPVDRDKGVRELENFRTIGGILDLTPRTGADIAIRCLHREAKLRYWDGPAFTVTPSYVLWPVGDEGLIGRAYHQTILAFRVKREDPAYREGIPCGSLDGYFAGYLARSANVTHAVNSDEVMVFSLYDTHWNSQTPRGLSRERSFRDFLSHVPGEQRKFALQPIEVRRAYNHSEQWERVAHESFEILDRFHQTTPVDAEAYERITSKEVALKEVAKYWQKSSLAVRSDCLKGMLIGINSLTYKKVLLPIAAGRIGRYLKRVIGPARSRALWRAAQRLIGVQTSVAHQGASTQERARDAEETRALLSLSPGRDGNWPFHAGYECICRCAQSYDQPSFGGVLSGRYCGRGGSWKHYRSR